MGQIFQVLLISASILMVSQFNQEEEDEPFKANDSFSATVAAVPHGHLITVGFDNELINQG